ncbi:MAG: NAD(+)/NADH kinase [Elusimicrobiaceae bacterium]|nr:NAD(+)/NADH kinase [Elusimicrobiaceae bacterium]
MPYRYNKIAVFFNERKETSLLWSDRVSNVLRSRGVEHSCIACYEHAEWKEEADLVISIGGDGTVLHAARDLGGLDIPLLALNAGTLGFLSVLHAQEFESRFDQIFSGGFGEMRRSLLSGRVENGGKTVQPESVALNDCVIKSMSSRAIRLAANIDGVFAKTYFCDGLIVATPSGSTAYALAASGPVVHPALAALLLLPICPHTLTQRPLVLPSCMTLRVRPDFSGGFERRHPVFSVDGQVNYTMNDGDEAVIRISDRTVKMLMPPEYNYFDVLSDKLKWGE